MLKNKRRFIYILFLAVFFHILIKYFAKVGYLGNNIALDLFFYFTITLMVWEGNRIIDEYLDNKISLIPRPTKRILTQSVLGISYTIGATTIAAFLFNELYYNLKGEAFEDYIVFSVVIPFVGYIIIFTAEISFRFFLRMKESLIDVEKYKAESLEAHLQNLKNQINPHFLFNNLSVLSSLVYTDQDKAVNFIQQLSKVYRYLLDNRNYSLVTLEKEIDFINSYSYLLKIRFEEKLIIIFDIPREALKLYIPPMALQILVENAIKHNETSSNKKLTLTISVVNNFLTVKNNLQPRTYAEPSSKTGLQNIRDRYNFLTNIEIRIDKTQDYFTVFLPLLNSNIN